MERRKRREEIGEKREENSKIKCDELRKLLRKNEIPNSPNSDMKAFPKNRESNIKLRNKKKIKMFR